MEKDLKAADKENTPFTRGDWIRVGGNDGLEEVNEKLCDRRHKRVDIDEMQREYGARVLSILLEHFIVCEAVYVKQLLLPRFD